MLQEKEFRIENLSKPLADIDINQSGSWVGITEFSDDKQSIYFGDKQVRLPEKIRFPKIRSIDEETVLFANARAWTQDNAWIITSSGEVKANFSAGDAIRDIVITKDFIVVTHFDEAACFGEGINVYDYEGRHLFGYHEVFKDKAVKIFDCYAACLIKENQIIFYPYNKFPLVLLNIEVRTQQIWETPNLLKGSNAVTKLDEKVYFHSPYKDQTGMYKWETRSEKAEKIGEHSSYFVRGLPNGKFLSRNDSGYSIISPQ
jgi:hypothetical protein